MPTYEFRCRSCGDTFSLQRPMSESSDPADCPQGHADTVRLLSVAAVGGSGAAAPSTTSFGSGGGGCCGGGCGCG